MKSSYIFVKEPGQRGAIVAFNPKAHKVEWISARETEWSTDIPQIWNGLVLAGNCQGKLSALSVLTGEPIWSAQLKGCIRSVGVSEHILYVGAQEGQLYAVRAPAK